MPPGKGIHIYLNSLLRLPLLFHDVEFITSSFIAFEYWHSLVEKYEHINVTAFFLLKTSWMYIFSCQAFNPTLK